MKKIIIIIFTFIFSFQFSNAGEPIWGVEIILEASVENDLVFREITNQKGHFSFSKIPEGTYYLKVLIDEEKEFLSEIKTSRKLYKKYRNSLKAAYNEKNKSIIFSDVAGCHFLKISKIKNGHENGMVPTFGTEFVGSKELVTISEISIVENKGRVDGKIQNYPLKKYLKKAGGKKFPFPVKRQHTDS